MSLDFARIKALFFDVDGTLRDTDDQYIARLERLTRPLARLFPRWDRQRASRRFVMTLDTPLNAVYTALDWLHLDRLMIGMLDRLNDLRLHRPKTTLPMIPGTRGSLERLLPRYPMTIISARGEIGTLNFLESHALQPFFRCVASGQTVRHTKPWPDPLYWCAEQIDIPVENGLMIGDTTVDIRAGRAAGAQTVGVLSGFGSRRELLRAGADLIVQDVAKLADLLLTHQP
jgi:phosphoglycolate phosphatase